MTGGSRVGPGPTRGDRRSAGGGLRLDVQGLRAVAVSAVVLDHAGVALVPGGYVGVDVFFVLSGFLITGILVRDAQRDGRVRLGAFYARRARRILPAATLVLVAVVAFVTLELSYRAVERVTTDAGWASVFLANVHFSAIDTDYFAQGLPPSPLQHYWSLSVEEQFYLVWPPLLAVLLSVCRRAGRAPWRLVAGVAGALCLASLAWSVMVTRTDAVAAYFSTLTRAWELGAGMLLALAAPRLRGLRRGAREGLAAAGLAAVLVAVLTYADSTPFPGYHALLPVLGTVAIVAAGPGPTAVGWLLSRRPATWVGDLSYSLYLWHWPVLVLWAARTGEERGPLETAALLGVALALSGASYHLVENPVRRGTWFRPRAHSLVLWPVTLSLVLLAVVGGRHVAEGRLHDRLQASQRYAALRAEHLPVRKELARSLEQAEQGSPVAFPLVDIDEVDSLAKDLWNYRYSCWVAHDRSEARICPVGDVDADRTMVLIGDSHAGQWLPAIDGLGREHGYRVVPLVKYGCVPYDVPQLTEGGTRPYRECEDFRDWVLRTLPALDPDVVWVGSRSTPPNMVAPPAQRSRAWTDGVGSFLATLRALAPDVRVLADLSPLDFDPVDCLTDARMTMATCTADQDPGVRAANRATRQAARRAGASFVDVTQLVCLDGRCPAFAGGRMVHANFDHLSVDWVEHVLPGFERMAERMAGHGAPGEST